MTGPFCDRESCTVCSKLRDAKVQRPWHSCVECRGEWGEHCPGCTLKPSPAVMLRGFLGAWLPYAEASLAEGNLDALRDHLATLRKVFEGRHHE